MSDDKFPHCREAGLKITTFPLARRFEAGGLTVDNYPYIAAPDVERLLAEAKEMYCFEDSTGFKAFTMQYPHATHTARLVGIKPIVRESEERQLLRELLDAHEQEGRYGNRYQEAEIRARRLLDGEK